MKHRPIYEIGREINKLWTKMYFGAVPYVDAMYSLTTLKDMYYADTADYILRYFLSNASTWRGEDAKRIKKEINEILKNK